jgi:hypothetical protein
MPKKPEVRMSEGTATFLVILVIAVVVGAFTNWYGLAGADATPAVPADDSVDAAPAPLQLIPAIEKTKVYLSTYDQADYDGEGQKNRVAGSADLIKSGNVIDTVTTATTGAVASTAEFNGGDKVFALGSASGYYKMASEQVTVDETLKPIEVFIKAAGTPDVSIEDDNGDTATSMTLAANEVSKRHTLVIERPGDDTWYQFCGIAANYDDEIVEPRVKVGGSYEEGLTVLDEDYDYLDGLGFDAVWAFDEPLENFDELNIDFLIGTEKDVNPSGVNVTFQVFDCEDNLQNGAIVYTNEDSADADLGLTNINTTITVN